MNRRDLELLSSYLDGQLRPSDSARLERRLSTDPALRAVLDDLRAARGLLRQLPMRKAPRNFTLTPKMVGKNPPLPRTYPAFKFVTALATLLLFFSVGVNYLGPQLATSSPALGMGGGGAPDIYFAEEAPAATEAPAAEAPAEEPSVQLASPATATASAAEDSVRSAEAPAEKSGVGQPQEPVQSPEAAQPVSPVWQIALAGVAVLGAMAMLLMRRLAAGRWPRK
jgi:anti-sigma factor RsiW